MRHLPKDMSCLEFRGQKVFALRNIIKGDVLECSPVIPLSADEWASISRTVLRYYCYAWGEEENDAAIALGYGSLFNCSPEQPAAHYINYRKDLVIEFFAARDIEKGEEVTVNRRTPGWPR